MIRLANVADSLAIAKVHVDSSRETYTGLLAEKILDSLSFEAREKQWTSWLEIPEADRTMRCFLAEVRGEIVGFCSTGRSRTDGFDAEMFTLYLQKSHHGKGYGAQHFAAAVEDLRARGFHKMMLWVLSNNPTLEFYKKCGGVIFDTKMETMNGEPILETALGWTFGDSK